MVSTKIVFNYLVLGSLLLGCFATTDIVVSDVQPEESDEKVTETFEGDLSHEPFIPTKEWQVIKEGQGIPAGLHVRMNFETGIKEAKLMDDNETNDKKADLKKGPNVVLGDDISSYDQEKIKDSKEKIYFTKAHLKEALKDFRDKVGTKDLVDDITWSDDAKEALKETKEDQERVRANFRTMKEIREDLEGKMGWSIKSDVEIMKDHMELLVDENESIDRKIAALESLEDYVHQIDNARDLDRIGGMEVLVMLLNSTNETLQEKAANVIGAATQNNKPAQDAVISYNAIKFLLRMFEQSRSSLSKKKGLFALSSLIRGNYAAQLEFKTLNGLEKVISIVSDEKSGAARLKGIMLIADLITGQNDIPDDGNQEERPDWTHSLLKNDWCNVLKQLLEISGDYDMKEQVLQAIDTSVTLCSTIFKNNNIAQKLSKQAKLLNNEIEIEADTDFQSYLQSILTLMKTIVKKINT